MSRGSILPICIMNLNRFTPGKLWMINGYERNLLCFILLILIAARSMSGKAVSYRSWNRSFSLHRTNCSSLKHPNKTLMSSLVYISKATLSSSNRSKSLSDVVLLRNASSLTAITCSLALNLTKY